MSVGCQFPLLLLARFEKWLLCHSNECSTDFGSQSCHCCDSETTPRFWAWGWSKFDRRVFIRKISSFSQARAIRRRRCSHWEKSYSMVTDEHDMTQYERSHNLIDEILEERKPDTSHVEYLEAKSVATSSSLCHTDDQNTRTRQRSSICPEPE